MKSAERLQRGTGRGGAPALSAATPVALPAPELSLYDSAQTEVVIDRMAQRCAALLSQHTRATVVGVLRRGAPLAALITQRMIEHWQLPRPLRMDLSVKRYDEDLSLLHPHTHLQEPSRHAALQLQGHAVMVVDDVLYSGHSLLRVAQHLAQREPAAIYTAVLVDRGCSVLPVRADVCGVRLDVAPGDIVQCQIPPYEAELGVAVQRRAARG